MARILVTLTSRSDSDFERSNVSLKETKPDGVDPNFNDLDHYVRKNEGKILWFSADCTLSEESKLKLHGIYDKNQKLPGCVFDQYVKHEHEIMAE